MKKKGGGGIEEKVIRNSKRGNKMSTQEKNKQ